MNYTQFPGLKVRINTKNNEIYEGLVWGFRFEDETEEVTLEVWTEDYTFDVSDIASIEEVRIIKEALK